MLALHQAGCPYWTHGHRVAGCTCPRPWRVRKGRDGDTRFAWVVERRYRDDSYELFLRASTFGRAIRLAHAMAVAEARMLRLRRRPVTYRNGDQ